MSVIVFNRLASGDAGCKTDAEGSRTYPAVCYEAITDDITDGENVIRAYSLTPKLYVTSHPSDAQALCIATDIKRLDGANDYWIITATFSTKCPFLAQAEMGTGSQSESPATSTDPLDMRPKVSFGFRYFKEPRESDEDGKMIRNSSWEPYPPEMVEVPRTVVHVVRNVAGIDPRILADCEGACNSLTFETYQPDFIKCSNLRAEPAFDKNRRFYVLSGDFTIANNSEDWYTSKLDAGYVYWADAQDDDFPDMTEAIPILVRGQRPARPVPLNGSGQLLAAGAAPQYNQYRFFRRADLKRLGFFT